MTDQAMPIPVSSLPEVHRTVGLPAGLNFWRRLFAFAGPAYMVSVGYMDPGNWATDLQGGARFGYRLIWVLLMSNGMAVLLQTLAARLGIVTGKDLAQACRDYYARPAAIALWILCEVAIIACDLAEVLGSAIGLHLLFGLDIFTGVLVTAADVLLLLGLQRIGIRKMEAFILALVSTIGICFILEMFYAKPDWGAAVGGLMPSSLTRDSLYIAVGIIGATVMPHNLYLHSALVQTRQVGPTTVDRSQACRYNLIDSVVALNCAFFVNAAILVLAAAAFHGTGHTQVAQLQEAHDLLKPLLGTRVAPFVFALALLCAGQSSTLTGTLAGQIVMEGFLNLRISPWLRRLITRSLAIIPAAAVIGWKGERGVDDLLVLSQVVLSLQLPFAIVPLIQFTGDREKMGEFATSRAVQVSAWVVAAAIIGLNGKMVADQLGALLADAGPGAIWPWVTVVPLAAGAVLFLGWLLWGRRWRARPAAPPPAYGPERPVEPAAPYRRIGVALEVGPADEETLRHATATAGKGGAVLVLMHVVQGVSAQVHGDEAADQEAQQDLAYLEGLAGQLRAQGYAAEAKVGYGNPTVQLPRLVEESAIDLLVIGSHGHRLIGDILTGSTVEPVRHRVGVPVLVVRGKKAGER